MIVGVHIHMEGAYPTEILRKQDIACIVNVAMLGEYKNLRKLQEKNPFPWISAGTYPWKVDEVYWDAMLSILEEVDIIDEAGLDTIWRNMDMTLQFRLSEQQLVSTQRYQKPAILHLKEREEEALEYLHHHGNRYLVYWYSCDVWLQEYIDLGCWLTVGSSLPLDEAIQHVTACVPLNRMLVETDSIPTCTWYESRKITSKEHKVILGRNTCKISEIRNISYEKLQEQMVLSCEKLARQRFLL